MNSNKRSILVVDDEPSICWGLERMLAEEGYRVFVASSAEEGLRIAANESLSLVMLDVRLPGKDGISALPDFHAIAADTPVIIMTAFGDLEIAVEAVQQGACEYLTKPFELDEALRVCQSALRIPDPSDENVSPVVKTSTDLVGRSPPMQKLYRQIAVIADSDLSVLVSGETGCGKELIARALHRHSKRRDAPYIAVAPVAMSEALIESELFGHVRGAFTGADSDRSGVFEMADQGTLLLDEIGDLPESIQVKLLRVLELGEYCRVGDARPRPCNVRVIAATHRDLRERVHDGSFREDLFYRLSAVEINAPALRDRPEDIPDLAMHFLVKMGVEHPERILNETFMRELRRRSWPGNIRELRNAVEHAAVVARGRPLAPENLPPEQSSKRHAPPVSEQMGEVIQTWAQSRLANQPDSKQVHLYDQFLAATEPHLFAAALEHTGGNRAAAADLLGIHRGTLRERLKRYEFDQN